MLFCRLIQAPFKARESFNNCVQQPYLIVYSTRHSRNVTHKTIALQHNINSISAHVGRLCHLYIWNWKDRHVLCLPAWPGAVAACRSRRVDRYLSGVGCQIMWCSVSGIASPVERAEGVHDGRARVTIACLLQMQCQGLQLRACCKCNAKPKWLN